LIKLVVELVNKLTKSVKDNKFNLYCLIKLIVELVLLVTQLN